MTVSSKEYDWASAIVRIAANESNDLGRLARVADLDPYSGDLSDVDLSGLDLSGQDFSGWDLSRANFTKAKLTNAELRNARVDAHELIKAEDWENAQLDDHVRQDAKWLTEFNPGLLMKVEHFLFSVRTDNAMKADNIVYVGDLVQKTEAEVLRMPNLGRKGLNEIKESLAEMGLHLGMEIPKWPPPNIERLVKKMEYRYFR